MKVAALLLGGILAISNSASAAIVIVDKVPNLGEFYRPLSSTGTYVYVNSFISSVPTGTLMDIVGVYMRNEGTGPGSNFRFEVYADDVNIPNTPDPTNVLGVTAYMQVANPVLSLITNTLGAAISLTNGVRYWIAASTVGQNGPNDPVGSYQVGGHSQNSIYLDNGVFYYSNDPSGQPYDQTSGVGQLPEMAIYAEGREPNPPQGVPEPGSLAIWGLGFLACVAGVRRRKMAA
jgi:hypothetical protein